MFNQADIRENRVKNLTNHNHSKGLDSRKRKSYEENDRYWEKVKDIYSQYPTVRHRIRFVINSISKLIQKKEFSFFDYGAGHGELLLEVKKNFELSEDMLGGCEVSKIGFDLINEKIKSEHVYNSSLPDEDRSYDVISCIEVIEHTEMYIEIVSWIKNHLNKDGLLILSTQTGPIYNSDKYVGHTQHFEIKHLKTLLQEYGFEVKSSIKWGFPFFSMQKILTNVNFSFTRENFLETKVSIRKIIFYNLVYCLYYIHDLINSGPQIFIVAKNKD